MGQLTLSFPLIGSQSIVPYPKLLFYATGKKICETIFANFWGANQLKAEVVFEQTNDYEARMKLACSFPLYTFLSS